MFPDRKQIIRILSTAACAGLLLVSLTQPSLTGAQDTAASDAPPSCELINALLDASLTATEWAIYPSDTDPSAQALADAALHVGDAQLRRHEFLPELDRIAGHDAIFGKRHRPSWLGEDMDRSEGA